MYLLKSIMCVYAMLNELCKKHQYWCNCHVSVPAIGVETALSSTVLLHKYRYTSDADDTHDVYVSLRYGVMEVAIRSMHKLIIFNQKWTARRFSFWCHASINITCIPMCTLHIHCCRIFFSKWLDKPYNKSVHTFMQMIKMHCLMQYFHQVVRCCNHICHSDSIIVYSAHNP